VVAAVADPTSPSDLVLIAIPVAVFAVWAFAPRTPLALVTVAALALAAPTYGIPDVTHWVHAAMGLAAGTLTLVLIGIAVGLAVPSARSAQAIGLIAFFPLYLLGGGGPPKGAMTGAMHSISNALPSAIPAIVDPWLGLPGLGTQLAVFAAWAGAALIAICWLGRRLTDQP
jgi:ABC-2 type transport system permease protein